MRIFRLAVLAGVVALLPIPGIAGDEYTFPGDAPYSVPKKKLARALDCRGGLDALTGEARDEPVLLVHGTGVTRRQNWGWNYWPGLHDAGFEVCWVKLPKAALGDIQVASEYVAWAIKDMHARSNEMIDVVGHSQGGLEPRWAIKWFASGRFVDDYVGFASPNHGTQAADGAVQAQGQCFEACWQMRTEAKLIAALNRDDETPGPVSYTNIYTQFDQLVQPVGTSALADGANILIQDLCPGRPVDHIGMAADAVTYALAIDALTNVGPADPARAAYDCTATTMPGADEPPDDATAMADWTQGETVNKEPPLMPYARP